MTRDRLARHHTGVLHPVFQRTRAQRALDLAHSVLAAVFGSFVFGLIALAIGCLLVALVGWT